MVEPTGTLELDGKTYIVIQQSNIDIIINDSYKLGFNAACKISERKDLIMEI